MNRRFYKALLRRRNSNQTLIFWQESKQMEFKPTSDLVFIRKLKEDISSTVYTGLQENHNIGIVEAVGPGLTDKKGIKQPMDVEVGDKVIFDKYKQVEVSLGDEDLICQHNSDIIAILEWE